jgi:hypothetical protein
MGDESEVGHAGATDAGGCSQRSRRQSASLQSRAKFLENWDWLSVTQINAGLCQRSGAQRGVNSETHAAVKKEWEEKRAAAALTLLEVLRFLQHCHRNAPFLFFNGNTFAEIGRSFATALFSDLPFQRRKEASSAVAHFVTGVLAEELMIQAIESLSEASDWKPGDRVKTLRGSLRGVVVRLLRDGRLVWKPDRTASELTALPESLCRDG